MSEPFWEDSYKFEDVATFGIEPNPTIKEKWPLFAEGGIVLDVGCGEGKNAIYLTQKGFIVDAFDISESGIDKLKRLAAKSNVIINAWVQDLRGYDFQKEYDVVTTHGTLHFVTKQEWKNFTFVHATDLHLAKRNDYIYGIIKKWQKSSVKKNIDDFSYKIQKFYKFFRREKECRHSIS